MELPSATPHGAGPARVSTDFDGSPACIARARRTAAAFLADHAPQVRDAVRVDVLLVVSELVTNAVRYAPGPLTLVLALADGGLEITVRDTSSRPPRPRTPGPTGGFGLPTVQRLARRTHVATHPGGKSVRVLMAL
jgi:anti-sigma regulatory factor (Ser/Thr protein kinase)